MTDKEIAAELTKAYIQAYVRNVFVDEAVLSAKVKVIKVLLKDMVNISVLKDMVQELIELLVQWGQLLQTELLQVKNYQDKWDM